MCRSVQARYPDNAHFWGAGANLHAQAGHWREARRLAERAVAVAPLDPVPLQVVPLSNSTTSLDAARLRRSWTCDLATCGSSVRVDWQAASV